jgi:nucleoid DNA-binding protein
MEKPISKKELIDAIAQRTGHTTRAIENILNGLACVTVAYLQEGERTPLPGLGILEPAIQAPRTGTFNGVAYTTPARLRPRLSPSAGVLRALNPGSPDPAADPVPAAA